MSRSYESPSRKEHAEATRLGILRALVDLIVEEGPGTISVPQVAARAGVSVRTVYHYFPTKEALFDGLTTAMPNMVATPDGDVPPTAHSPAELASGMPGVYRYLEANRRMFRALSASELGGRVAESRRPERHGRMDTALEPLRERLDDAEYRRLRAVIGLVVSFDAYDALSDVWGLSTEEAAEAAAWAVRTLCERARRSGVTP
ncbi:MAG: helix-turn-helix domain-containing protein [Ilumatobacteraceae bacterium]